MLTSTTVHVGCHNFVELYYSRQVYNMLLSPLQHRYYTKAVLEIKNENLLINTYE